MASRVENITDAGIRRRFRQGVVLAIISIAAAIILIVIGSPRWMRLFLFVPFAIAANGFLQAREKTCVVLGAMGTRETSDGGYARMSEAECVVAKRQVVWIVIKDVLIAVGATALVWLI
jgi:hypothetical protein